MIYRSLMSYIQYSVLKDCSFFPAMLGGSGDLYSWGDGLPTWNKPANFDIVFVTSVGFFLEDTIELLVKTKNKDFIEMLLHHFVTCVLIYFSYIANLGAIGAMIVFLHYIADIFVAGAKCFNEMKGTLVPACFMAMVQISWAYT